MGNIASQSDKKIYEPKLSNALSMHLKNPKSFWIPNDKLVNSLKRGDFVKVANNIATPERFWVKIIKKKNKSEFVGIVSNKLLCKCNYNKGDLIAFKRENIYNIKKKQQKI